jgi:hypothetical protein
MNTIDLTRRKVTYPSGRTREQFILLASEIEIHLLGGIVHLGGRKNLLTLRRKIDKYLNDERK